MRYINLHLHLHFNFPTAMYSYIDQTWHSILSVARKICIGPTPPLTERENLSRVLRPSLTGSRGVFSFSLIHVQIV